jgi:hypothetical protein
MSVEEQLAVPIQELRKDQFKLSDKKVKSWNWTDKEGKAHIGSQEFVEVYYGKKQSPLTFSISDVRTINGIQTSNDNKRGFMSVNLKEDQSSEIRKMLDDNLFDMVFENRKELLKHGHKISHPSEIRLMFQGFVKDGDEKHDGTGGRYNDQITCTVPMKRKGQQIIVDDNVCIVEDLDGKPYNWMGLDRQKLKDIVIEVEKIIFGKDISVRGTIRLVVPESKSRPRVVTKRQVDNRSSTTSAKDVEEFDTPPTKKQKISEPENIVSLPTSDAVE